MGREISSRELVKSILQGAAPPRPLFLPIVFSLAARIENLPLRAFLANPTRITRALRQIHAYLRSDGLTCYLDPYLQIEALGGILEWGANEQPSVHWARDPVSGDLPEGLPSMDELPGRGRIPVAVEVIRRLKSLVRDESLFTVGINGPFALAAQITLAGHGGSSEIQFSTAVLELASGAIASVAAALVEAGANVVFIREQFPLSASDFPAWAALLTTTINIVRFYEALPVLLLQSDSRSVSQALGLSLDCVVCPVFSDALPSVSEDSLNSLPANVGIAIPASVIAGQPSDFDKFGDELRQLLSNFRPALITTSGDVPETADLKNLTKLRDLLVA